MNGLVYSEMEQAVMMDKTSVPDGYGGFKPVYVPTAEIMAAFGFDTSTQARIAEQEGATNRFAIFTKKNINLQYHDVVKRVSDGKIFRVTTDGDDSHTPKGAGLDLRRVEAEEWEIPQDEQATSN